MGGSLTNPKDYFPSHLQAACARFTGNVQVVAFDIEEAKFTCWYDDLVAFADIGTVTLKGQQLRAQLRDAARARVRLIPIEHSKAQHLIGDHSVKVVVLDAGLEGVS